VAQRMRRCATNRKVAGSTPDGVIGIFHWHNPSGRTINIGFDSASNRNEYQEHFYICIVHTVVLFQSLVDVYCQTHVKN
jgi:hypothetical protein